MDRTFRNVIRRSMSLTHARTLPPDLSSSKIRRTFIDYFCKEHKHLFIRSSPVFSLLDPTLAFVNAGMNQFKDVFLGIVQPPSTRIANSQKCIRITGRHNDVFQVGEDGSHHTFFEMLGNWSFGDYFKEDACRMSWDLLTNVYGIPPESLYVTYFEGDEALGLKRDIEVQEIWKQIGVKENHIIPFGIKDNFWEGGVIGPCGPCTEIHYDTIPGRTDAGHLVNKTSSKVIELWNLVFTQYNRKATGELETLKSHFVDTGMGFERLVAVLQGKTSNYDTDLFLPLFDVIKKHTGHSGYTGLYDGNTVDCSYRIIADHSRMIAVAVADGMMPKRQLKVRALFKRALSICDKIFGANADLLKELTNHVADSLSDAYPEVGKNLSKIHYIIEKEDELIKSQKQGALPLWRKIQSKYPCLSDLDIENVPQLTKGFNYIQKNILSKGKTVITSEDIWVLFDTYGVPPVKTEQLALKLGLICDMSLFNKKSSYEKQTQKESQQEKYFKMRNETSYLEILAKLEEKQIQPTLDYFKHDYRPDATGKYIFKEQPTTIQAIICGTQLLDEVSAKDIEGEKEIGLILDRTQFFCKEGSQLNDTGAFEIEKRITFDIKRLIKIKHYVIHFGTFTSFPSETKVAVQDIGTLRIDEDRRLRILRNHTTLHLLNAALRSLLPIVMEKQSVARPEELVLNFLVYESKLNAIDDIRKLENYIKEFILHGVSVKRKILNIAQFQAESDVIFIPGESMVKLEIPVVEINSGFKVSKEYCTGAHLLNTSDIGDFVVTDFKKGSYGTQTIKGVTGNDCILLRKTDSEKQEEWLRLKEEISKCNEFSKMIDLSEKLNQFDLDVEETKEMTHIARATLKLQIQAQKENLKLLKKNGTLIAKEIQEASEATSETFVIHCLENCPNFNYYDQEAAKNSMNKPFMLLIRENEEISIRCFVPKSFVSDKFSAETWLLDTITHFGGIGYHETNVNPHLLYSLKKRKFTEKQLNQFLELARDFARKNISLDKLRRHGQLS